MNSKQTHIALVIAVGLLFIGLVSGTYEINQLLGIQSNKLISLKAKSLALDNEQISLNKAKKDIKKYKDLETIARAVVPEDKNQAEAVREIVNIAAANDISLSTITFPTSTLGNAIVGKSGIPTPAAATPPASSSKGGSGLSQLQPLKSISGVYQLFITVNGDPNQPVPYNKFINFLSELEHNRRTAQVSTISLQPDTKNRNNLTFVLTLNEYIKP